VCTTLGRVFFFCLYSPVNATAQTLYMYILLHHQFPITQREEEPRDQIGFAPFPKSETCYFKFHDLQYSKTIKPIIMEMLQKFMFYLE
jgi:hypothetical protein